MDGKGSWGAVDWHEFLGAIISAGAIGMIRVLYFIRKGRTFRWIDVVLEPSMAILGGLLVWMILEEATAPDLMQAVMTSLGAWGGPRTIHWLEQKYLGGSRFTNKETAPGELDNGPL